MCRAGSPALHLPPTGSPVSPSIRGNPLLMQQGLRGVILFKLAKSKSQGRQGQIKSFRGTTTEKMKNITEL